jgi:ATP-binding cassette subfamily F protein 3
VDNNTVSKMRIAFPLSVQPGKWVIEMHNAGKSYGEKELFKNINITVGRGEKIALLGPNGIGKSTLLKLVMKEIEGEGTVEFGHNVNVTYFSQNQAEQLDVNKTVLETVDEIAVGDIRKDIRSLLGAFLFSGEDVDKKVSVLSGGERTRLALCQLLLSPSNVLILDEPTNHLDIQSKEVLKEALLKYEGTFIIVSHDREFLDGLTNRIWDIEDKTLKIHHFGVKEFLQKKMQVQSMNEQVSSPKKEVESTKAIEVESREIRKLKSQIQNKIKKAEDLIATYEEDITKQEALIANLDYSDEVKANKVLADYEILKQNLETEMLNWDNLVTELSQIK